MKLSIRLCLFFHIFAIIKSFTLYHYKKGLSHESNIIKSGTFFLYKESPTNYHAITAASRLLADQGFTPLSEQDAWTLLPGENIYVSRGETSLFAFRMPEKLTAAPLTFQIVASHDSPCFKLKKKAEMTVDGHYTKLNVERYGGSILSPWFDRPLLH